MELLENKKQGSRICLGREEGKDKNSFSVVSQLIIVMFRKKFLLSAFSMEDACLVKTALQATEFAQS